ncbi:hypothetical protein SeMB42_g05834 [Synchytrium endobioticum]|uniref:Uncharacterized protein n=1 Tax=Synchytrium endobioticum TaxID=286115 RepID=A0A507CP29_9FUNG|nr:hypothetical protein SeMB42_g05834 [Synchytrium endobioticum]
MSPRLLEPFLDEWWLQSTAQNGCIDQLHRQLLFRPPPVVPSQDEITDIRTKFLRLWDLALQANVTRLSSLEGMSKHVMDEMVGMEGMLKKYLIWIELQPASCTSDDTLKTVASILNFSLDWLHGQSTMRNVLHTWHLIVDYSNKATRILLSENVLTRLVRFLNDSSSKTQLDILTAISLTVTNPLIAHVLIKDGIYKEYIAPRLFASKPNTVRMVERTVQVMAMFDACQKLIEISRSARKTDVEDWEEAGLDAIRTITITIRNISPLPSKLLSETKMMFCLTRLIVESPRILHAISPLILSLLPSADGLKFLAGEAEATFIPHSHSDDEYLPGSDPQELQDENVWVRATPSLADLLPFGHAGLNSHSLIETNIEPYQLVVLLSYHLHAIAILDRTKGLLNDKRIQELAKTENEVSALLEIMYASAVFPVATTAFGHVAIQLDILPALSPYFSGAIKSPTTSISGTKYAISRYSSELFEMAMLSPLMFPMTECMIECVSRLYDDTHEALQPLLRLHQHGVEDLLRSIIKPQIFDQITASEVKPINALLCTMNILVQVASTPEGLYQIAIFNEENAFVGREGVLSDHSVLYFCCQLLKKISVVVDKMSSPVYADPRKSDTSMHDGLLEVNSTTSRKSYTRQISEVPLTNSSLYNLLPTVPASAGLPPTSTFTATQNLAYAPHDISKLCPKEILAIRPKLVGLVGYTMKLISYLVHVTDATLQAQSIQAELVITTCLVVLDMLANVSACLRLGSHNCEANEPLSRICRKLCIDVLGRISPRFILARLLEDMLVSPRNALCISLALHEVLNSVVENAKSAWLAAIEEHEVLVIRWMTTYAQSNIEAVYFNFINLVKAICSILSTCETDVDGQSVTKQIISAIVQKIWMYVVMLNWRYVIRLILLLAHISSTKNDDIVSSIVVEFTETVFANMLVNLRPWNVGKQESEKVVKSLRVLNHVVRSRKLNEALATIAPDDNEVELNDWTRQIMNSSDQAQHQIELYDNFIQTILPSFTTFSKQGPGKLVVTDGGISIMDIDSLTPVLFEPQLTSTIMPSTSTRISVTAPSAASVNITTTPSPPSRHPSFDPFPTTLQKQDFVYTPIPPSRNTGYRNYTRNEFRSLHSTRKSNTSRPPSLHVDEFRAREQQAQQLVGPGIGGVVGPISVGGGMANNGVAGMVLQSGWQASSIMPPPTSVPMQQQQQGVAYNIGDSEFAP